MQVPTFLGSFFESIKKGHGKPWVSDYESRERNVTLCWRIGTGGVDHMMCISALTCQRYVPTSSSCPAFVQLFCNNKFISAREYVTTPPPTAGTQGRRETERGERHTFHSSTAGKEWHKEECCSCCGLLLTSEVLAWCCAVRAGAHWTHCELQWMTSSPALDSLAFSLSALVNEIMRGRRGYNNMKNSEWV